MTELSEKIVELEIKKEAIKAAVDELKTALDAGEITKEDCESSINDYKEQLAGIDKELEEAKKEKIAEEAKEPAAADYESMSWTDLQRLASDKGLQVIGVTKEKLIAELKAMDAGEAAAPIEEPAPPVEEPVPVVEEPAPPVEEEAEEEVPIKREIDPSITARVEMLKGEVPSLNSTLKSMAMKLQVSKSSLEMIKKNKEDGLVDSTTYNNLKTKYEDEINNITGRMEEIEQEARARENVVKEYGALTKVYEDHSKKTKTFEDNILDKEMEMNFMGSSKFYLVSNIKDHVAGILSDIDGTEEELSQAGISYPDEAYIGDRKEEIERENENLADVKTKISNFDTLLKSLQNELKDDEVDKETYELLKTEYTREKNRTIGRMGRIEGKLNMLQTEMKAYDKLEESLEACKSYIDMVVESFNKIWLEDKIKAMNTEINKKVEEIKRQEKEMSAKLIEMEKDIEKLLAGLS